MSATSFISEHTAEYILVPKLTGILRKHFGGVIPLFFLITREGSKISRLCDTLENVRIINVFPRRPKITTPNQLSIEVKFNESLFDTAQFSSTFGIPTFAGVPLASSIFDLTQDTTCAWFELTGFGKDTICKVSLDGKLLSKPDNTTAIEGTLGEDEIINRIFDKSSLMKWHEAVENLVMIKYHTTSGGLYGIWARYRPFHLVLFE